MRWGNVEILLPFVPLIPRLAGEFVSFQKIPRHLVNLVGMLVIVVGAIFHLGQLDVIP